ncbi:GNAT family N-acetyltransferase [Roseococcus sp. DSY-14]|uniref:GNAT family N-acetyltransferase n=1 Tax=Roseococcus sp. DSY-14 TaxID=3369650 RepID=UPI00387B1252
MTGPAWRDAEERDVPAIHRLLRAMAAYEKLEHEFRATAEDYRRELFGPAPSARALVAEAAGEAVAVCLFHRTFPSFSGRAALWIEDIFVQPAHRRRGLARAAFAEVARRALAEGCGFVEWNVLDWNAPAIAAYRAMGAVARDGWTDMRLSGDALTRLAEGAG